MKKKSLFFFVIIFFIYFNTYTLDTRIFPLQGKTYTVRKQLEENVIKISGNISAAQEQKLQLTMDGFVEKIYVKEGDSVKKGDVLIEYDTSQQEYNLAKHNYLIEQKQIIGAPRREMDLLLWEKDLLVKKIEERKVIARFDGIIAKLNISVGDFVAGKESMGFLIDRSYFKSSIEIIETDINKIKKNQAIEINFPAYVLDYPIAAYIVSYPLICRKTSKGIMVIDVIIRVDNIPDEILIGYSFTGIIKIDEPRELLLIEKQAIGFENGLAFVEKVLPDGLLEKVFVFVEVYDSFYVKILEGLNEFDTLKDQGNSVNFKDIIK